MELTVEKMALIRDDFNLKNRDLNLNIDWSVEFTHTDQKEIKYDIILKSGEYLNLNFKLEGLVILGNLEKFIQQECSQIVFNHACSMLMNAVSLTRQTKYELLTDNINSAVNLDITF